ncbi:MAG TPA: DNA cytosine methyltransferase, partial [Gemmatimonadaceae bacterium]
MTKNLNQLKLPLLRTWLEQGELVVDNFAGGGGASSGVEIAIGRSPDIAINHDDEAIAMHKANHPECTHYQEDIRDVDPIEACTGPDGKLRPVALAWFSPDCKHFSKAKGCTPKDQEIRGLAWTAVRWAAMVKPRIICLENVEEFKDWGPLVTKHGKGCDGLCTDTAKKNQKLARKRCLFGMADKTRKGETFNEFVGSLQNLGYQVEHWLLRACDYGAPTSRRRFVMVARCDGKAIVKPEPTHGPGRQFPYRTAAECIEWNVPAPSIFERKKSHKPKTLARIARGVRKFVLASASPFVVPLNHGGADRDDRRVHDINEPMRTITGHGRGSHAVVTPFLSPVKSWGGGGNGPSSIEEPMRTITASKRGEHALVVPYMVHRSNGERPVKVDPDGTVHAAQAPRIYDIKEPLGTIMAQGQKHALVSAMLIKHNGGNNDACGASGQALDKPVDTVTSRDAKSLATVTLGGKRKKLSGETLRRARAVYA